MGRGGPMGVGSIAPRVAVAGLGIADVGGGNGGLPTKLDLGHGVWSPDGPTDN